MDHKRLHDPRSFSFLNAHKCLGNSPTSSLKAPPLFSSWDVVWLWIRRVVQNAKQFHFLIHAGGFYTTRVVLLFLCGLLSIYNWSLMLLVHGVISSFEDIFFILYLCFWSCWWWLGDDARMTHITNVKNPWQKWLAPLSSRALEVEEPRGGTIAVCKHVTRAQLFHCTNPGITLYIWLASPKTGN